jgi:hypothetical protein
MKNQDRVASRVLGAALAVVFLTALVQAQPATTVIPYLDTGYKYQQVAWGGMSGFEAVG